jgi:hypothetical protein
LDKTSHQEFAESLAPGIGMRRQSEAGDSVPFVPSAQHSIAEDAAIDRCDEVLVQAGVSAQPPRLFWRQGVRIEKVPVSIRTECTKEITEAGFMSRHQIFQPNHAQLAHILKL